MIAARSAGPHYRVEAADPAAHLFHVTLTVPQPQAGQRVSLPAWIPGSYLVREFARHLQKLTARQDGRPVAVHQQDKASWQVDCVPSSPLVLSYEVYAFDHSVRTAWLDSQRGFFNGTSLCLRVHGQAQEPHELELVAPRAYPHWEAATGLTPLKTGKRGFGTYQAHDYDELVDCPVELGAFWSGEFRACGVPHRVVVAGAAESFDGERLLADMQKICETQIRFWHDRRKPPMKDYLFLLNAVDDGYGGLEHRNSTALIASRRDLPRIGEARTGEGYVTLMGLISHEYFHTWNVKRLRPAEFAHYEYSGENYTQLLWFFEGFTSYYDDLLLRRAGLIDDATYFKLLTKTCNQVLQTPGREVQSVAQASFDAWVKYYRQDENTANATVSYYTKGALVAACFDLTLRAEGHASLDDVMRALWQRCKGGPMAEADFAAVLKELGGRAYTRELAAWVHGTRELPLKELLEQHGVQVMEEPAQMQQRLGVRVAEAQGGIVLKNVLRGGAAEQAGFAANDEWIGVEVAGSAWRLSKLDDLLFYAGSQRKLTALVARDRRILRLDLAIPAAVQTWRLVLRDAARVHPWLGTQH
ncbi:MAG TPA: peptidase M61 [Ramlibacter sp.]|uniref:M61 family metallopeptidase n=1 Tax=Ramlibacter sp. TaxID=1917967 RepID=UPI002ED5F0EF